jgi:hypothetical protein
MVMCEGKAGILGILGTLAFLTTTELRLQSMLEPRSFHIAHTSLAR